MSYYLNHVRRSLRVDRPVNHIARKLFLPYPAKLLGFHTTRAFATVTSESKDVKSEGLVTSLSHANF